MDCECGKPRDHSGFCEDQEPDEWNAQFDRTIGEDEYHRHCSRCEQRVKVNPAAYAQWALGAYLCGQCFIARAEGK